MHIWIIKEKGKKKGKVGRRIYISAANTKYCVLLH
jgi:hypothetical protein